MDVTDIKALHSEVKKRMDTVLEHLKRELGGVRTGRASVTLLDPVQVEAYGSGTDSAATWLSGTIEP